MLNLRKVKMSAISLSQVASLTPTNGGCRAFYGSYSQNLALEWSALMHRSMGLQFGLRRQSCLSTGELPLKEWATSLYSFTQTRCLHGDANRPQLGAQEANVCEDDPERATSGSIHLIVGPMFAGKTTALLNRVEAEAKAGRRVALVKSDKDTRYGLASIVSHDGRQMPCWAVPSLANFRNQIGEDEYAKLDVIGIDEAQFLKDLYSFCQVAADYDGKTVIVAGLDGDFQRNKFGAILDLVPLADSFIKLSALCEMCGKPASFTFRKTDNNNKEVIGGTDIYMPVCRQHYFSGKIAMEATRRVLDTHTFIPLQLKKTETSMDLRND